MTTDPATPITVARADIHAGWLATLVDALPDHWRRTVLAPSGLSHDPATAVVWHNDAAGVQLTARHRPWGTADAELTGPGWRVTTEDFPADVLATAATVAHSFSNAMMPDDAVAWLSVELTACGWGVSEIGDTRLLERCWTSPDTTRSLAWCPGDDVEPDCFFANRPGITGRPTQASADAAPAPVLLALLHG